MKKRSETINVIGGGLAGSEAALVLARFGFSVRLFEMRPSVKTPVHKSDLLAELVCSNSFKSLEEDTAAGMLKLELAYLASPLFAAACENLVGAGSALAVNRTAFAGEVTKRIVLYPNISLVREEVPDLESAAMGADAAILATGPLTSDSLSKSIKDALGLNMLAFFDAASPIVMGDSLDMDRLFYQNRYGYVPGDQPSWAQDRDYLNASLDKQQYEAFIDALVSAKRVILRDFETKDLFQACQPIEEVAASGRDAPRFGAMKPVGIVDPRSGRRPWACVQLRREDREGTSYNLVGFQTNLTFAEQKRVFQMIPGLENAEFARFGVMHRNTFLDAPKVLEESGAIKAKIGCNGADNFPFYVAGQLSGTEGYTEAIRSGHHAALSVAERLMGIGYIPLPRTTAFGALMTHATDPEVSNYQPMHVNFGIMPKLMPPVKNKSERAKSYAQRARTDLGRYKSALGDKDLLHFGDGSWHDR